MALHRTAVQALRSQFFVIHIVHFTWGDGLVSGNICKKWQLHVVTCSIQWVFIYCFTYIHKLVSIACQEDCKFFWRVGLSLFNIKMSCWIKHDISNEHGYGLYELTCCIRYLYRLKFVICSYTYGYNGHNALLRACLEGIIALTRPWSSCVQFVMAGLHSSLDPLY